GGFGGGGVGAGSGGAAGAATGSGVPPTSIATSGFEMGSRPTPAVPASDACSAYLGGSAATSPRFASSLDFTGSVLPERYASTRPGSSQRKPASAPHRKPTTMSTTSAATVETQPFSCRSLFITFAPGPRCPIV